MLRDAYAYGTDDLKVCLKRFSLGDSTLIDVRRFQMLTPDSFIWKLRLSDGMYYLYAEDHLPHLEHVEQMIGKYTGQQAGHFIETTDQTISEPTTDRGSTPDASLLNYVVNSGYDGVLLYKIDELTEADKAEL